MKKILVVGDTILDHYVHGNVERVNPEAPHSVVLDYQKEDVRLGGAANVAANIKSLTGDKALVHYYGAVSDQVADLMTNVGVACSGITHTDDNILLKTRYICNNHYLLRVDRGKTYHFGENFEDRLREKLNEYQYDLIVISDYNKGTLSHDLVKMLLDRNIKTIFDLKKRKNFVLSAKKRDNVILKCNKSEFETEIDNEILRSVKCVIQTVGSNGAVVWSANDQGSRTGIAAPVRCESIVADVVGAGDAFLAGIAREAIRDEWDPRLLAEWGNHYAACKVQKFGTYVLKPEDL